MVRVPEYVPDVPTAAVQERVLEAIPWRLRGVFMARGLMGLRPSEARNVNLSDYWFDPGDERRDVLTVRKSKSNRYRLLPVPAPVSAWVRDHHSVSNLRDADAPAVRPSRTPTVSKAGAGRVPLSAGCCLPR